MTKILVNQENAEQIEQELREANGRARSHTINSFAEVEEIAEVAEEVLDDFGLSPSYRPGAYAEWRSQAPSVNAYRNWANVTGICLKRTRDGWVLWKVARRKVFGGDPGRAVEVNLSEKQKDKAQAQLARRLGVSIRAGAFAPKYAVEDCR